VSNSTPFCGATEVATAGNFQSKVELSAIGDGIADNVFGQFDFVSGDLPLRTSPGTLNEPAGAVISGFTGEVFIADTANNRVLIWQTMEAYTDGQDAAVSLGQQFIFETETVEPPRADTLRTPTGLALDIFEGLLVVADTGNNRVVIYEAPFRTGMDASIVIGQPDFVSRNVADPPDITSLNAPRGVAVSADNSYVVVADTGNHRVLFYRFPIMDGAAAEIFVGQPDPTSRVVPATPSAISMDTPTDVAISRLNNRLYVLDAGNNRVLIFDNDPVDPIADVVLGQPNFTSAAAPDPPTANSLRDPQGLFVDTSNNVLVADTGNNRVLFFGEPYGEPATGVLGQPNFVSRAAPNPPTAASLAAPRAVAALNQSQIIVADTNNYRALRYNAPFDFVAPQIAELSPATVRVGRRDGPITAIGLGFFGITTTMRLNNAETFTGTPNFWVVTGNLPAELLTAPGTITVTVDVVSPTRSGGGRSNTAVLTVYAPEPGDDLADRVLGQRDFIQRFDAFSQPSIDLLRQPSGITIDRQSGRIFVADEGNSRVVSWPNAASYSDGAAADLVIGQASFFENAPSGPIVSDRQPTARSFAYPNSVAVDADGNLFVSDPKNFRVLLFRAPLTDGMAATKVFGQADFERVTVPTTPTANNLYEPSGLALDAAGNLYVADSGYNRVLIFRDAVNGDTTADVVIGQGGSFTTATENNGGISASSLFFPLRLAVDNTGNLYVSDTGNNRVLAYRDPLTTDTVADAVFGQGDDFTSDAINRGGLSARSLSLPIGLDVDTAGNLYVADTDNHRVLIFRDPLQSDTQADQVLGQANSFSSNLPNRDGIGRSALTEPVDLALDAAANLSVLDFGNSRLLGYDLPLATSERLYLPLLAR
jgi:sugar lactone lactonase YvrE